MIEHFKDAFIRDLLLLKKEVSSYTNESTLWEHLPGTTNSGGNLCLHLTGNINHFIGAGVGNNGYVRERDHEFSGGPYSKQHLITQIENCVNVVEDSFKGKTDNLLSSQFPLPWAGGKFYEVHFMLTQLVLHFNYHLGQINYHRRYFSAL